MQFSEFDVAVCVTIMLCMLVAFLIGGARSLTGMAKWAATVGATLIFYPKAQESFGHLFANKPIVGNVVITAGLFIASLIVFTLFAIGINSTLGAFKGSIVDRIFGLMVGFAIGGSIVSALHFGVVKWVAEDEEPKWLKNGLTYPYTKIGADMIKPYMDRLFTGKDADKLKEQQKALEETVDMQKKAVDDATDALDTLKDTAPGKGDVKEGVQDGTDAVKDKAKELQDKLKEVLPDATETEKLPWKPE